MNINSAMKSSAAALSVERLRMDVISGNIANANSTETAEYRPFRRKEVLVAGNSEGPRVLQVQEDTTTPFRKVYMKGHPQADSEGYVEATNSEPILEMVNMLSASRAYEANVTAFNTAKNMAKSALQIGKV